MPELLDACPVDAAGDDPDHLPWIVLFASALDIGDPDRRRAAVLILAAAYRTLFPRDA
jgi:hypothetical protein